MGFALTWGRSLEHPLFACALRLAGLEHGFASKLDAMGILQPLQPHDCTAEEKKPHRLKWAPADAKLAPKMCEILDGRLGGGVQWPNQEIVLLCWCMWAVMLVVILKSKSILNAILNASLSPLWA